MTMIRSDHAQLTSSLRRRRQPVGAAAVLMTAG